MIPQGPKDAAEDGDRGELRRQVMNLACRELGEAHCMLGNALYSGGVIITV